MAVLAYTLHFISPDHCNSYRKLGATSPYSADEEMEAQQYFVFLQSLTAGKHVTELNPQFRPNSSMLVFIKHMLPRCRFQLAVRPLPWRAGW